MVDWFLVVYAAARLVLVAWVVFLAVAVYIAWRERAR